MREVLKCIVTCLIIIVWGIAVKGSIEAHGNAPTVSHDSPMMLDEIIELKTPEYKVPEIPDVRLATFEDEFAVKPLIRNLTEEEKDLLVRISMSEAGNQDTIGKALIMLCVLNRCERTGLSVRQVIYSPHQFAVKGMCAGNEDAYKALELILSGWDESEGATSFRTLHYHPWGTPLFQHQAHYFSK